MGAMSVNSLLLFLFFIIVIAFVLGLITPLIKTLSFTVSRAIATYATSDIGKAIKYTLDKVSQPNSPSVIHESFEQYAGEGIYYIGLITGNTFRASSQCEPGDICVVYFSPVGLSYEEVKDAISSGSVQGLGVKAYRIGDVSQYDIVEINGEKTIRDGGDVIGVIVYSAGIKRIQYQVGVSIDKDGKYSLDILFNNVDGFDIVRKS